MKNLQPQGLWSNFYDLTQIPRPSGQKEEISAFLANYGPWSIGDAIFTPLCVRS